MTVRWLNCQILAAFSCLSWAASSLSLPSNLTLNGQILLMWPIWPHSEQAMSGQFLQMKKEFSTDSF